MRFFLCCILLVLGSSAFSQTHVRGTVQDKDGVPVDCFNAMILRTSDSLFIAGAACFNGNLSLETQAAGRVLLQLSALGYEDLVRPLELQGGGSRRMPEP